jgi:hypothetical protein
MRSTSLALAAAVLVSLVACPKPGDKESSDDGAETGAGEPEPKPAVKTEPTTK